MKMFVYKTFGQKDKISFDELDILIEDDIQLELFLNTMNSSDFENDEQYNIAIKKLYEILRRTKINNQIILENKKGIIQRIEGLEIILETNKEYKNRLIDEATSN